MGVKPILHLKSQSINTIARVIGRHTELQEALLPGVA
jgi:hypothetical protein